MQAIRPCFSTFVNFSPLNLVNIYSASLQYGRHPPRSGSDLTKIDRGTLLTTSPSVCLWKIYYPYVSFSPSLGILIITARQQAYVECGIVLKLRVRDGHYPACVIRRKFLGHFLPFSQQRLSPVSGSGVAVLPGAALHGEIPALEIEPRMSLTPELDTTGDSNLIDQSLTGGCA